MKKIKKVIQKVAVEKIVDILCNNCGKTCSNERRQYPKNKRFFGYSGLIETEVNGGFDSEVFGVSIKFSICEKCLDKIVKKFKIKPEKKDNY